MTKKNPDKIKFSTAQVLQAIKERFPKGEYALLTEVGNATGFRCNRHADVIVMSLWPSRGLQVIGFEIKASRTDWLKELETPEKADAIYGYCDIWWLAVGDEDIIKLGELPPNWGLMVPKKDGMANRVLPVQNPEPKPLDRGFIAAMLRRAQEQLTPESELKAEFNRGKKEGIEDGKRYGNYAAEDLKQLQEKISKFEKASGVSIQHEWDTESIGHAVRLVRNGMHFHLMEQLGRLEGAARTIADQVAVQMKILQEKENEQHP